MDTHQEVIELSSSSGDEYYDKHDNILRASPHRTQSDPIDLDSFFGQAWADVGNGVLDLEQQTQGAAYGTCLKEVVEVFPDISHDHVKKLYDEHSVPMLHDFANRRNLSLSVIEQILDAGKYPKEKDRLREIKELKRKRENCSNPVEEAARWKNDAINLKLNPSDYTKVARIALQEAFPMIPVRYIDGKLKEHSHYYAAHLAIAKAEREYDNVQTKPYAALKSRRSTNNLSSGDLMLRMSLLDHDFDGLKQEIEAAQQRQGIENQEINQRKAAEAAAEAEDAAHRARGEVMECACCFDDAPISKITHCNGDSVHFFCYNCARSNADSNIGLNRYDLQCMDGSSCKATFSRAEREKFLDQQSLEKLENLEQEAAIRAVKDDLKDFVACPFCQYGHICPPIEVDREFRCGYPDCREISCRLCKEKSHIPLSCEEFKKENGVSERHAIEEARTEALVRTCNKCKVRILKEDGCNKVTCTTCYSVLCDYCGKDITSVKYEHFDGQGRGLAGLQNDPNKCPLYDTSGDRKDKQIEDAGKVAMDKIREENPDLLEDDLKIKFSKEVEATNRAESRLHLPHIHHYFPQPLEALQGPYMPQANHGIHYLPPGVPPVAQDGLDPNAGMPDRDRMLQQMRRQQAAHQAALRQRQQHQQLLQAQDANIQHRQQATIRQRRADMQALLEPNRAVPGEHRMLGIAAPEQNQRDRDAGGVGNVGVMPNVIQDAYGMQRLGQRGNVGVLPPVAAPPANWGGFGDHRRRYRRGENVHDALMARADEDIQRMDVQLRRRMEELEQRLRD